MTRPFPLKGKVKQIITAQTMLPNNYSRHEIQTNLSQRRFKVLKISSTWYMCTQRYQSQAAYSL